MKKRYTLKLIIPDRPGAIGTILKLFPNGLTFVGYLDANQLTLAATVSVFLIAFGVSIEVKESPVAPK